MGRLGPLLGGARSDGSPAGALPNSGAAALRRSLLGKQEALEGGRELLDVEAARPGGALEDDPAAWDHDDEAVRPSSVGPGRGIVDVVDEDRDAEVQVRAAGLGDLAALPEVERLLDEG